MIFDHLVGGGNPIYLCFTSANRAFPPCTLSRHPDTRERDMVQQCTRAGVNRPKDDNDNYDYNDDGNDDDPDPDPDDDDDEKEICG